MTNLTDPGILWEAHKPVIRGIFTKHGARINREHTKQLSQLLHKLEATESRHKHAPSQASETDLTVIRKQITDLLHSKAKAVLQFCRKMSYESGDKCGKLLARMVREHKLCMYIPQVVRGDSQKVVLPAQITHKFKEFYSHLYNVLLPTSPQSAMEEYIKGIPIALPLPWTS